MDYYTENIKLHFWNLKIWIFLFFQKLITFLRGALWWCFLHTDFPVAIRTLLMTLVTLLLWFLYQTTNSSENLKSYPNQVLSLSHLWPYLVHHIQALVHKIGKTDGWMIDGPKGYKAPTLLSILEFLLKTDVLSLGGWTSLFQGIC